MKKKWIYYNETKKEPREFIGLVGENLYYCKISKDEGWIKGVLCSYKHPLDLSAFDLKYVNKKSIKEYDSLDAFIKKCPDFILDQI